MARAAALDRACWRVPCRFLQEGKKRGLNLIPTSSRAYFTTFPGKKPSNIPRCSIEDKQVRLSQLHSKLLLAIKDVKVWNSLFRNPGLAMISQTVEYALRAIVTIAQHDGTPCTAQKISSITKVPAPYLSKLMQGLVRGNLVTSKRGLHGSTLR